MSSRIQSLEWAIRAHNDAAKAVATIADILHGPAYAIESRHYELEEAAAAVLSAAEQMRSAVHDFQGIDRRMMGGY